MYADNYEFMSVSDLFRTIGATSVMGVDGVVLWNDHTSVQNATMCAQMAEYVKSSLGPTVQFLSNVLLECSELLCGGRGRCILKQAFSQRFSPASIWKNHNTDAWYCHCYEGHSGQNCAKTDGRRHRKEKLRK